MGPLGLLGLLGKGAARVAPYVPRVLKKGGIKGGKTGPYANVASKDVPISYGRSATAAGAGGLLFSEMFGGNEVDQEVRTGGQGLNPAMPQVRGRTPIADNWSPSGSLENNLEYSLKMEARNAKVLKKVLMQGAILKAHNPNAENTYVEDALSFLKADALQKNNVRQARIIEGIKNKDGTLPDDAKVIYDRIVRSGGTPAFAAEVSGHQLAIEKTQAEAAADYMRGQPKLTDMYSKDQIMMMELKQAYDSGDQQNSVNQLAYYIKSGLVKIPEIYSGFEVRSDADLQDMAARMLQGLDGSMVMSDDEIIIKD